LEDNDAITPVLVSGRVFAERERDIMTWPAKRSRTALTASALCIGKRRRGGYSFAIAGGSRYEVPPWTDDLHTPQALWSGTMSIFGKIMGAIFGTHAEAATPAPDASGGATSSSSTAAASVDVAAILDKAVAAKKEKLAWRTSIVDLMKALDVDSSLSARKELAKDLHYPGDTNDSAAMNVWLHKQMMAQLAANGGKLPPDMKH
jgi:hypothetical protein